MGAFLCPDMSIMEVDNSISCKTCFISEKNIIQEMWISCTALKKPFAEHSYSVIFSRSKSLNPLKMVRIQ
jgi:hypothetical protein